MWKSLLFAVAMALMMIFWWAVVHHMDENGKVHRKDFSADMAGIGGVMVIAAGFFWAMSRIQ